MTLRAPVCMLALAAGLSSPLAALADPPASADTRAWNNTTTDKNSVTENNCYNYALDRRNGKFAQPGRKAGAKWQYPRGVAPTVTHTGATPADAKKYKGAGADLRAFRDEIRAAAAADGLTPIAAPGRAPRGDSVVALVVGYVPDGAARRDGGNWKQIQALDYHWFRLNVPVGPPNPVPAPYWSHKPGEGDATVLDDAGGVITNPENLITADETKSRYDLFVGYFHFTAGAIEPEMLGEDYLVNAPEGVLRMLAQGTSGVRTGWCESDRGTIRALVSAYLTGLAPAPAPSPGWSRRHDGFVLEAMPRTLTLNPGVWEQNEQVRITARAGLVEVMRYRPGQALRTAYYVEAGGLVDYLALQAETRLTIDPCPGAGGDCYADCDQSTGVEVLDIFDFLCFQNRFASNDPYACDCDMSSGAGRCDIFDFLCFQNAYAAGCP